MLWRSSGSAFVFAAALLTVSVGPDPTAAASETSQPITRVAFGSCADQDRPQEIWEAVLGYTPELFIFAGDNVYGDVSSGQLLELREAYNSARHVEGLRRLRSTTKVLATWDDHDYGRNDGGADFPWKAGSQRLFADFWELPDDDPRRWREGVYHAETLGPPGRRLQIILLDTRSFRSPLRRSDQKNAPGKERYMPDPDPAKTFLGEAQWRWLEARLREPAELRLIVSSIQVLADGHGWERWGNLPRERERLFTLIRETGAEGILLLSGDRHIAGLYRLAGVTPYPLIEITSSSLNLPLDNHREPGPNRLGATYEQENFGSLDIDWEASLVALSIRDVVGRTIRRLEVPFAALRVES